MKFNKTENNAYKSLKYLLIYSGVKVSSSTLREKLWYHPDFPKLTSVSDTLNELKVPNLCTQLEENHIHSIPLPALAMLNIDGGIIAPILKISENTVEWLHTRRGPQKDSIDLFLHKWTGIAVLIEPTALSGEKDYHIKVKLERFKALKWPSIGLLLATLIFSIYFISPWQVDNNYRSSFNILLGIKICGLLVSSILTGLTIDNSNALLNSICKINYKTNCNSILASDAAKLWGIISWAEIGLMYFSSTIMLLLFGGLTATVSDSLLCTTLLSFMALPYTVYSIGYQFFIAKRWCLLCLVVQLVLWIEVYIGFSIKIWNTYIFTYSVITLLVFSISIPLIIWLLIKPLIVNSVRVEAVQKAFQHMKFDTDYVRALTNKQRFIPPIFPGMKVGKFGKVDAENSLVVVTNPTCSACSKVHKEIKNLIDSNSNINCTFIIAGVNDGIETSGKVANVILNLPEERIEPVLSDWFDNQVVGFEKWKNNYIDSDISSQEQFLMHLRWLDIAGITNTPYILLNGMELPRIYAISEVGKLCHSLQLVRI